MDEPASLHEALGGDEGFGQRMAEFAQRLLADADLAYAYPHADVEDLRRRLVQILRPALTAAKDTDLADFPIDDLRIASDDWPRWSGHLMTVMHLQRLEHAVLERLSSVLTNLGEIYRRSASSVGETDARLRRSTTHPTKGGHDYGISISFPPAE